MENTIKKTRLINYIDKLGLGSYLTEMSITMCIEKALEDGIEQLIVTPNEFRIITSYILQRGCFNWDKKTILGIELIIIP